MSPRPRRLSRHLLLRSAVSAVRPAWFADRDGEPLSGEHHERLRDQRETADLLWQAFLDDGDLVPGEFDLEVAEAVALLYWYRWAHLPEDVLDYELPTALWLFRRIQEEVPRDAPGHVPVALRFLFGPPGARASGDRAPGDRAPADADPAPADHVPGGTERDLSLIARGAWELLIGDEEKVRDSLDDATALVERARRLVRELGPQGPYTRAAVAIALAEARSYIDDPDLPAHAEELAASVEAEALRGLLGDRTDGATLAEQRERLIRWSPSWQAPPGAPETDLRLVRAVADVRWADYIVRDDVPSADVAYLAALYREVHAYDPDLVPNALRPLFDPGFVLDGDNGDGDVLLVAWLATDLFDHADDAGPGVPTLDQAITLAEESVRGEGRRRILSPATRTLRAQALVGAFEYTRRRRLLDTAVADARQALADTPPDSDRWLARVAVLGNALLWLAETDPSADGGTADADADMDVRTGAEARAVGGADEGRSAHEQALGLLRTAIAGADRSHPEFPAVAAVLLRAVQLRLARDPRPATVAEVSDEIREVAGLIPETFPGRDLVVGAALLADWQRAVNAGDLTGLQEINESLTGIAERLPPATNIRNVIEMSVVTTDVLVLSMEAGSPARFERALARYQEVRRSCTALEPGDGYDDHRILLAFLFMRARLIGDPGLTAPLIPLLTDDLARARPGSPARSAIGAALGAALIQRFQCSGDRSDLDRGTALLRRWQHDLENTGPGYTDTVMLRGYLAEALRVTYLATGDEDAYEEAIEIFRAGAADPAEVFIWLESVVGGDLAAGAGRWNDALDLYGRAIESLGSVVRRRMARADHEWLLAQAGGAVAGAAHATVRLGDPEGAVEWLERGRAVLYHQRLDAHDDLTRLRADRPRLADRIENLQAAIDRASGVGRRRELDRQLTRLLAEVRSRPGYEGFLAAPTYGGVRPAEGQTVALVNHSAAGSHALLATAAGVRAVPLPLLDADTPAEVEAFQQAVRARFGAPAGPEREAGARAVLDTIGWLRRAVVQPVLDAIDPAHTAKERGRDRPRIHWCPTGRLSLLPLHAAALDDVVSSYAPSLRILARATAQPLPPPETRSLLVVALPDTPGLRPLPGAALETDHLSGLLAGTRVLSGDQATHESVRQALGAHAWAHFACHAAHDLDSPSRSRLFLHDHETAPLTVEQISELRLTHARLAYLSACETARGTPHLPDEALHLGGALQLAGYQHVIATLWPIHDAVAALVTRQVYAVLRDPAGPALDPAGSASALHRAVRALRDRFPDDPALWAAFVHFGP